MIKEALFWAASFFRDNMVYAPRLEGELLLAHCLQKNRVYLYACWEEQIPAGELDLFRELLKRRVRGEPLAYLTGEKEFMGLAFKVCPDVLVPRPETEHLVEAVLSWCARFYPGNGEKAKGRPLQILDLGTGSGNIAVALAFFLPLAAVTAVDLKEKALQVARANAKRHRVISRLRFLCGDFWEALDEGRGGGEQKGASSLKERFDVIVANPPYIRSKVWDSLPSAVKKEPRLALDGGGDGLDGYRKILKRAGCFISNFGLLALEIGSDQAAEVVNLSLSYGLTAKYEIIKDYAGHNRVLLWTLGENRESTDC